MNSKIHFKGDLFNEAYKSLFNNKSRYLLLYGGGGSGKSVFAAQKLIIRMLKENSHRFLLIRKVGRTIRNSQYQLIRDLVNTYQLSNYFEFRDNDLTIKSSNGNIILSTGVDNAEKLKSIHGVTGIWVEEATELSKDEFLQIDLRLRGETENYKQILMSFNPIDCHHWLKSMFFDSSNPNSTLKKTTFLDNKFIDDNYKEILQNLEKENSEFFKIYNLGEWVSRQNLIFPQWELYDEEPEKEEIVYGLDFGYNNPTALVKCMESSSSLYLEEILYRKQITNGELVQILKDLEIGKRQFIYADSAEPQRIEEIRRQGFNIHPADKNRALGIDFMKQHRIFIHKNSKNLIGELREYKWKTDMNGNVLDEPVKINDHLLDAARYASFSFNRKNSGKVELYTPKTGFKLIKGFELF